MIGMRLKEERERIGLTQDAFALLVNAGRRTVIDWEKGRTSPNAVQLSALAEAGMDMTYVLTGQRSPYVGQNDSKTLKSAINHTLLSDLPSANSDLMGRTLEAVLLAYKAENARIGMRNAGELAAKIHNDILSALGADSEASEQLIALKMAIQQLRRELQVSSIAASKDKRSA